MKVQRKLHQPWKSKLTMTTTINNIYCGNRNTSLRYLDINSCSISDKGAVALALALSENDKLVTLLLSNNHLSEGAGMAFCDIVEKNTNLTHIDVKGNQIDHSTFLKIAKILKRNKPNKMVSNF